MHDTKMNSSHFSGIIVNQANRSRIKFTLNRKLFTNFSLHCILKRLHAECKKRVIYVIYVPPNTKRPLRNQTLLASLLAANIMQNTFPISDHDIRNNLFE